MNLHIPLSKEYLMNKKPFVRGLLIGLCVGVALSSLFWSRELLQSYVMTIDANSRTYDQAGKELGLMQQSLNSQAAAASGVNRAEE